MKTVTSVPKIILAALAIALTTPLMAMEAPGYRMVRNETSEGRKFTAALKYITDTHNTGADVINFLKQNRFLLGVQDRNGYTLLMRAAKVGRAHVVEFILQEGVREGIDMATAVNQENTTEGNTALAIAAKYNHRGVVERLLKAQPNHTTIGRAIAKASRNPEAQQGTVPLLLSADRAMHAQEPQRLPYHPEPARWHQPAIPEHYHPQVQPAHRPHPEPRPIAEQPHVQPVPTIQAQPQPTIQAPPAPTAQAQEEDEESLCPICLETLNEGDPNVVRVGRGCTHMIHGHCLGQVKEKFSTCPICRAQM